MSYTEIFRFDKDGTAQIHAWVNNPWQGAMAIWRIMEERHLPQYIPQYVKDNWWYMPGIAPAILKKRLGFLPSRIGPGMGNAAEEIFDLADNPRIPMHERIVLYTTFDNILVRRENVHRIVDAFHQFEGDTSLPVQAKVLERLLERDDYIAIGWNQTSVSSSSWENYGGYDIEKEKEIPYNCLTMQKHQWLFEELVKNEHVDN